jgi:hypothetical protein
MFGWLRGKGRVDYQTPPPEAPTVSRLEALADVDIRLAEIAGIPPWGRTAAHWEELDWLLDRRARLTVVPVPVAPGPIEPIATYWERRSS